MTEERFRANFDVSIYDSETEEYISASENGLKEIAKRMNEQQAIIQRMKHSLNTIYKAFEKHYGYDMRNAVWLIDELSYDEIVDELYIAETDSKNRKEASMYWKKKVDEQQDKIDNLLKEKILMEYQLKVQDRIIDEYERQG